MDRQGDVAEKARANDAMTVRVTDRSGHCLRPGSLGAPSLVAPLPATDAATFDRLFGFCYLGAAPN